MVVRIEIPRKKRKYSIPSREELRILHGIDPCPASRLFRKLSDVEEEAQDTDRRLILVANERTSTKDLETAQARCRRLVEHLKVLGHHVTPSNQFYERRSGWERGEWVGGNGECERGDARHYVAFLQAILRARELAAKHSDALVAVVSSTRDRYLRHHGDDGQQAETHWVDIEDLKWLKRIAGNVILATILDPDASWEECNKWNRGWRSEGAPPKRPPGHRKLRWERFSPIALEICQRYPDATIDFLHEKFTARTKQLVKDLKVKQLSRAGFADWRKEFQKQGLLSHPVSRAHPVPEQRI